MFSIFQKILDRKMFEYFPNGFLGEIYGRARARLPFRIRRYDREEDCTLEALYVDERDHEWEGTVASQMGFGEFIANINSPLPSMLVHTKHATYDVEQRDGTIVERFKCHLTEDQGFVWTGLPAKSLIQWEPQTTIIKDGNMLFLRGYGPNDNSESPVFKSVYAILRDGLVVCFFIDEAGTMNMQITSLASQTIEINSKGIVLMFSSQLHAKPDPEENEAG
ncbi:hypothetical protein KC19_4G038600 [Ceratodon purpureus]|uniref:Uncharacterized protein n=1 Tax=Ceratodon purpureus TaxID=3225 RepID=A0A8T0I5A2_CERPU|nr:hypothetical protein KC19_4G038600 [Ceratodon purpureus]